MAGAQAYSTLEVSPHQPHDEASGIEAYQAQGPNAWDESRYLQPNTNKYHKPEGESYELSDDPRDLDTPSPEPKRKRTICGLPRWVFIVGVVAAVLVVIGAVVGGVVGTLSNRKHKDEGSSAGSTDPEDTANPAYSILKTSRIAAVNRTIGSQMQRTVLFQDGNGALMTRQRMGDLGDWSTINLTLKFASTPNKVELPPGAPLAAGACAGWNCEDIMAFYVGTDGIIHGIRDWDTEGEPDWKYIARVSNAKLNATNHSQLAVTYTQSLSDTNDGRQLANARLLAYQDPDGNLMMSNDSSIWAPYMITDRTLPNLTSNTSLAMITQLKNGVLQQISLVAKVSGKTSRATTEHAMVEAKYPTSDSDDTWTSGDEILNGIATPNYLPSEATQQFAVTMQNNWRDSIYLALSSNGTISGRVIGQNSKTLPTIRLRRDGELREANFSAIATTMDGYLYGLYNDTISEYSFDSSDPSILDFKEVVYDTSVMVNDRKKR